MTPSTGYSLLMLGAGLGIPVMAAINATLGGRIGNPTFAAFVLFAVGIVVTAIASWYSGLPALGSLVHVRPYLLAGGLFVAFYVLSITWAAAVIGVGNAVFLVLLGQLMSAAVIDHFGWLGAPQSSLSLRRVLGLMLMALGVYFARRPY